MTADTTLAPRAIAAWRNAVFAIFFLSGLSVATWVSRIPTVRDDTGLGLDQIGAIILCMSIGSIIGLVAAQWMLARFGARRGMTIALGIVGAGILVVGVGSSVFASPAVIVAGMALLGFGNGAVDVMMNVEGALAEQAAGKTLMPLMHAFFSFGTVAGALIGAGTAAIDLPVAWHFGAAGALIAVAIAVAVRFVPVREAAEDENADGPKVPFRERLRTNLSVWRDGRLLLIGVVMLGMAFAEGSANDWITLAAVDGHGTTEEFGAIVFSLFAIAMTTGRVLGGPLLDRFGRVAVLRATAVVGIIGLVAFIFGTETWMLVAGAMLWGLGASLGFPVGISAAADDTANAAARVSAVAMVGYFAFLVGPPGLGFLGEHYGVLNALLVVLGLMVASALAAPATRKREPALTASAPSRVE
ncbi:MFS transporter [Agromyces seonyuensis]|uniref:MFS transporter n=1 Tax=Agromyces seonyuensis TaxID=2662446 RepID=A0A6I4P8U5_9MICO|nr:MFS transporter [Agromyces seonyuensis]MWC00408.1 MFS transporter [Agromyces seonyuensis]